MIQGLLTWLLHISTLSENMIAKGAIFQNSSSNPKVEPTIDGHDQEEYFSAGHLQDKAC